MELQQQYELHQMGWMWEWVCILDQQLQHHETQQWQRPQIQTGQVNNVLLLNLVEPLSQSLPLNLLEIAKMMNPIQQR
jgi:hypothetical protein